MDIKGKGSLLLLAVSTLVLCQNVASNPICLQDTRCQAFLQDLYYKALFSTMEMQFNSLELFMKITKQYSQNLVFHIPGIRSCHTAQIPVPASQQEAELLQHKDIIHVVIRLLRSWDEPLTSLALEAHRLPKLQDFFSLKRGSISQTHRELTQLAKRLARHLDPETTDNVDYASWSGLQLLQASDEKTFHTTFYNTVRCLLIDSQKIESLLVFLNCKISPDNCNDVPVPFVSEKHFNDTSSAII
ncbi:PREDICTED: prolactin-like [Chinchilla lanigera]|uniref:Prolactin n=1 Tax=Chinchilla lanigera TaxID=34839 RepID=A0A8C2UIL5_CHILA|nr:PREDICTED: prolactin-like [Chinchilla lanigera]